MAKKPTDEQTTAALAVVDMEQKQEAAAANEQQQREQQIAESYEIAGRIQAFTFMEKVLTVGTLVQLKKIKESKAYRDLPGIGSWDKYCEYLGFSRQKVDLDLQNLSTFGETFLQTVGGFGLGYRDLKKLRQLTNDGTVELDCDSVTIDGEVIPLDGYHVIDLQAAIENVLEAKTQEAEEAKATVRAKDRIIKGKEDLINKQEKELAKHESRAKKQGFAPGEEAFLKQLEADKLVVDGILTKYSVDDEAFDVELTERMKAGLVETLGYLLRIITAHHAAASDLYETDGNDWNPDALLEELEEGEQQGEDDLVEIIGIAEGYLEE